MRELKKTNRGKRRLAFRLACILISVLMMFGLYQPGSRVYAWAEEFERCEDCGSSDITYTCEIGSWASDTGNRWNHQISTGGEYRCNECGLEIGIYDITFEYHTYIDSSYPTEEHWSLDMSDPTEEHWIPSYTENGVTYYICDKCGHVETRQGEAHEETTQEDVHSHTWDQGTVTTSATYTSDGVMIYTCTGCGETRTEAIPKLVCASHTWDNGKVTTEPTYKNDGVRTYTCTTCGQTRTETISKLVCASHTWDNGKVTTEPTYKADGIKTYTCENCGETKTETIPKLVCTSHSWDDGKITTKATYKKTGIITYTCNNCGKTKKEELPKLECGIHVCPKTVLTPVGGGVYYYVSVCTRCGETESTLHEHEFKWVTVKPASEEETGTERYLCEECGYYSKEREIPRIDLLVCTHPYPREFVETVPATCCRGPIGNVVCKECGEIIVYDYEYYSRGYDPDNHTHFTEKVTVEPTYKTTGVKRFTCDGCGYYYTESIPKLECPHAHTGVFDCLDEGLWKKCKDCGEKLYQVYYNISRCDHIGTTKKQVLVKAATSTEWGEVATVCECGKTVSTEKIHPYSEYQVTKPDGSVVTVYGWFDYDSAREIADLTNAYRLENGLNALTYNESLQSGSDLRALEIIVSFSHTRPDGTRWTTTLPEWQYGGENLASGQTTVESAMNAWKKSESHNRNLLYGLESGQTPFKGISVGVFHRILFPYENKPYTPYEYTYYTQQFTFY